MSNDIQETLDRLKKETLGDKQAVEKSAPDDLLTLRLARGFNRSEFARLCGVARPTVWRWETGRRRLSAEMCRRVADVLGVDMETVLDAVEGVE